MILVMLGTQNNSFYRLLEKIEELINDNKILEDVVIQAGYTKYESDKMKIIDFVSKKELEKLQDEADIIITHGGVGSIISSLQKEKKVIAVPRKHEYLEHVNNHQEEIVETFDKKGYIIGINDVSELEWALNKIKEFQPIKYNADNDKMINLIDDFIAKSLKKRK